MITPEEARKNPELMIKYKDDLKNIKIFKHPWYWVFEKHPYLYREFSNRFDEMDGWDISHALRATPALIPDFKDYLHKMGGADVSHIVRGGPILVLDLKNHLHKMGGADIGRLLRRRPELSLCIKYKDDPDKAEASYYVAYPHELNNLNKEEKREMSKRIMELLREEKI